MECAARNFPDAKECAAMNRELSLSRISFFTILVTALTFSVVIGFFTVKITDDSYDERVERLESDYIRQNKELVKREIERAIHRISRIEKMSYGAMRHSLEEKVDFAAGLLAAESAAIRDPRKLVDHSRSALDAFKWDGKSGYFYIIDDKGNILYHGAKHQLEHTSIFELARTNPELRSFITGTLSAEEHFGSYPWPKPDASTEALYKKYVYAKKVPGKNLYIAAGVYRDVFEEQVRSLAFDAIGNDRFGENGYGYFWVLDLNNRLLVHPDKSLLGKDLSGFRTLDGQYLFPNVRHIALEQGAGYISYVWNRPDVEQYQDEKISYIQLIPDWGIIIGSGFYLTELKEALVRQRGELHDSLMSNLRKSLAVLSLLIGASFLAAWFVAGRIRRVETAQKEHRGMLEQYKMILDESVVVSKADPRGIITYVNDTFCDVSGFSREEVIGRPHSIVRHPETPKTQFKQLWETIRSGRIWKGVIKNRKRNGESYYNSTTIVPIHDSEGHIIEYISSGADVTELVENRSKLQTIFKTDALTGLGNRVSLIDTIDREREGALVFINIDRFKEINDLHGNDVGDRVIKELGSRLFESCNAAYTLYRVQSDIFALYTLEKSQDESVETIRLFMEGSGREPYVIDGHHFILTYTAGIAWGAENLFTYADMALSEAKRKKLKTHVYDPAMNNTEAFRKNIEWVERLHLALEEDRIVPYFQPIYDFAAQRVTKYECLMRLIENGEPIAPGEYLPVAKKTKLYPELTYKIVEKSINRFAGRRESFSINIGTEDLMNEELMIFLFDYARQKNVFDRLVLEIVESEEIEDSDAITTTIRHFKEHGVKIAIDDFGSGYSNYDYLISLQADFVKIDGSIVKHVLDDERTAEVVRSIVTFARKSGMKTIAEFVSSAELDAKIRELGVDFAQGYFRGRPEAEPARD